MSKNLWIDRSSDEPPPVESESTLSNQSEKSLTKVFDDTKAITNIRVHTISNARYRLDVCDEPMGTLAFVNYKPVLHALINATKVKTLKIRFITEITKENIEACKILSSIVELRHLDGVKGNFAVSENEYYAFARLRDPTIPSQAIYSALKPIVSQQQYVFDILWSRAVDCEEKIQEIEEGRLLPKIEVIRDPSEKENTFVDLVDHATSEIMLFFPTAEAFHREEKIGVIDALGKAGKRNVKVRILTPIDESISRRIENLQKENKSPDDFDVSEAIFQARRIEKRFSQGTVTVLIVDRKVSFVLEQKDNSKETFSDAVGLATFSTSEPNVLSHVLFFELLWQENELRLEEERARKRSELLQDILTHDIRNYNQIVQLGTEMLFSEQLAPKMQPIANAVLEGIRGSTALVERAKKLARLMSEGPVNLHPVELLPVLTRAMVVVKRVAGNKEIESEFQIEGLKNQDIAVFADDFLIDVFENLYTNASRYTDSQIVSIQTTVEAHGNKVKISIADRGRGIPDERKNAVFSRYLTSEKGTGLGMSIVYALVVERYGGTIQIKNRVPEDYTQGTRIDIFLKNASGQSVSNELIS
ncbi:MAG: ATP-binding protein [Nitrososphaerales archaeon]